MNPSPRNLEHVVSLIAWEEIQVALRDGDLHAVGRVSTKRAAAWMSEHDGWPYHSGRYSSMAPKHWRAGQPSKRTDALNLLDRHFIDIRMQRFMVFAIWLVIEAATPVPMSDPATGAP